MVAQNTLGFDQSQLLRTTCTIVLDIIRLCQNFKEQNTIGKVCARFYMRAQVTNEQNINRIKKERVSELMNLS